MKIISLVLLLSLAACTRPAPQAQVKHRYPLTGKIVSLDPAHQTAKIDGAAIPNYMEAMTMDYPIRSKGDFSALKAGDRITATVDVADDDSYTLSNVRPQASANK